MQALVVIEVCGGGIARIYTDACLQFVVVDQDVAIFGEDVRAKDVLPEALQAMDPQTIGRLVNELLWGKEEG